MYSKDVLNLYSPDIGKLNFTILSSQFKVFLKISL